MVDWLFMFECELKDKLKKSNGKHFVYVWDWNKDVTKEKKMTNIGYVWGWVKDKLNKKVDKNWVCLRVN